MRRFATLAVAIAVVVGCNRISAVLEPGPEESLRAYFEATSTGDLAAAYAQVSASDRAARSLADYQADGAPGLAKAFAGMATYEVVEVTENGATAIAHVDVTAPDFSQLMGQMLGPALAAAFGGEVDAEQLGKDLASKAKTADLPKVTRREDFQLVRDPDGWRVFLDWEREDRTKALVAEAALLREAADLGAAAAKYGEALQLDSELVEAKVGLEGVRKQLETQEAEAAVQREKQDYIGNVQLKDFRIAAGERFGRSVKGVFGTVVNQGDRTLNKVEVTVYFLDHAGNVVGEEDYHPVLVTKFAIGDNKPLKPNYVEDFGYSVEKAAPSAWGGRAKARITDISFAE